MRSDTSLTTSERMGIGRADMICPICHELHCQTWTCSRCECVLSGEHLIPNGWSELSVDDHAVFGLRRHYFCEPCSRIVAEFVDMLTRGPR